MIDTQDGTARLLSFLPDQSLPSASLLELTKDRKKANAGSWSSGLQRRVAVAWRKPMTDLTCGECRTLVTQKFGLRWLAQPVAVFATRYPLAECDFFPGDLAVNAVIAWRDLVVHAPSATKAMLAQDMGWLRREAARERGGGTFREALAALDDAIAWGNGAPIR